MSQELFHGVDATESKAIKLAPQASPTYATPKLVDPFGQACTLVQGTDLNKDFQDARTGTSAIKRMFRSLRALRIVLKPTCAAGVFSS